MKKQFQSQVSDLLQLLVHSLYSHSEIFLRELISNASDALDKLRYLNLTQTEYKDLKWDPKIQIELSEDGHYLTIQDNGIGMNEQDLENNLGTLAHSGTKKFMEQFQKADSQQKQDLIGQFGVGFYSVFMVSDHVEVYSKKALEGDTYCWSSDGHADYELSLVKDPQKIALTQGTKIVIHLNEQGQQYGQGYSLLEIVKKYSNHIAYPIYLKYFKQNWDETQKKSIPELVNEQVNQAQALWKQSKSELKEEDYQEFYKTTWADSQNPLLYLHTHAEGTLEYTTLFYVGSQAPFNLYQNQMKPEMKLYVNRVLITDHLEDFLPNYLRFVRGIVDCPDLPLNVSREILQKNQVIQKIQQACVPKLLKYWQKISQDNPELYTQFIQQYNRSLKEGLYSDFSHQELLLELVRFQTSKNQGWRSLADYKQDMGVDQKSIYYLEGKGDLNHSPYLKAYLDKGYEVLFFNDEIDPIVFSMVTKYKDLDLKSIQVSQAQDELKTEQQLEKEKEKKPLAESLEKILQGKVSKVLIDYNLQDTPAHFVRDTADMSSAMKQMFEAMGQQAPSSQPILTVNPDHHLLSQFEQASEQEQQEYAQILYGQAQILDGQTMDVTQANEFLQLLNKHLG